MQCCKATLVPRELRISIFIRVVTQSLRIESLGNSCFDFYTHTLAAWVLTLSPESDICKNGMAQPITLDSHFESAFVVPIRKPLTVTYLLLLILLVSSTLYGST